MPITHLSGFTVREKTAWHKGLLRGKYVTKLSVNLILSFLQIEDKPSTDLSCSENEIVLFIKQHIELNKILGLK